MVLILDYSSVCVCVYEVEVLSRGVGLHFGLI